MDKIYFKLPTELKQSFKVKATVNKKDMTELLVDFIKSYVGLGDKKRRTA